MSLSLKDIDEIMRLLEASPFNELKLETGELKLHLRRGGVAAPAPVAVAPVIAAPTQVAVPAANSGPSLPPPGPGEVDVPSPLLGVFYRAPKPGEPAFVEVGQTVTAESIIGIVEVMKLMNSVRAGVAGTVVAIHAPNAEMVEFDQPLVRIRAA